MAKTPEQYKNHKAGSRKGRVHQLFDEKGPEAAFTLGRKLKLKETTLRSWFGAWRREDKFVSKPEDLTIIAHTKRAAKRLAGKSKAA